MKPTDLLILTIMASVMLSSCATTANRAEVELVHGYVAPGYEQVKLEFERNLRTRGEIGGAFAAYVDGELVVDLWGGWADPARTRPWEENTLVPVFSATKGLADDASGIAAAYVTNRMAPGTQIDDPRERALRHALYRAVENRRP